MDVDELLETVLSLPAPWSAVEAEVLDDKQVVEVKVSHLGERATCPKCSTEASKYDSNPRRWRHLDLCDYQAWIVCEIPRVNCPTHGVHQVDVPWADGWSRFTAHFECRVIDWLLERFSQVPGESLCACPAQATPARSVPPG